MSCLQASARQGDTHAKSQTCDRFKVVCVIRFDELPNFNVEKNDTPSMIRHREVHLRLVYSDTVEWSNARVDGRDLIESDLAPYCQTVQSAVTCLPAQSEKFFTSNYTISRTAICQ